MKKLLLIPTLTLMFAASALSQAPEPVTVEEKEVYGRVAKTLQKARQAMDQSKSADSQNEVFQKGWDAQCDSRQDEIAKAPNGSDLEKLKNYEEFLDQFILLSDRLIVVDSGKRGMDCYGAYYLDYSKQVESRLKELPEEVRLRMTDELDRYLKATGQKPKKESAASGGGSRGKR
ncbi:MAG: hypothetical protein KF865_03660 [Bdellovibrionaceae bacterium]|nr:hypothetical protein [Pseudobdellovibrionaceae bacterium]